MTDNQNLNTTETYSLKKFGTLLKEKGINAIALKNDANGVESILVNKNELIKASKILKESKESLFDLLISVSAVDKINENIFESVNHLYSTTYNHMLVLKTQTERTNAKIPTVSSIWETATWHEREAYDLMGIEYEGHPDLRRILMPVDWKGHPLRKDYVLDDERLKWNER